MKFRSLLIATILALSALPGLIVEAQGCYDQAGGPVECRGDKEKRRATRTPVPSATPTLIPSATPTAVPASNLVAPIPPGSELSAAQGNGGGQTAPDGTSRGGLPPTWMLAGLLALVGGGVLLFRGKGRNNPDDGAPGDGSDGFYFNPKEIKIDKPVPFAKHQKTEDASPGRRFAKWTPNAGGMAPPDGDLGALPDQHLNSLPDQHLGNQPPPEPESPAALPDQHLGSLPDQHLGNQPPPEPESPAALPDQNLGSLPDQHLGNQPPPEPENPGALPEPHM